MHGTAIAYPRALEAQAHAQGASISFHSVRGLETRNVVSSPLWSRSRACIEAYVGKHGIYSNVSESVEVHLRESNISETSISPT